MAIQFDERKQVLIGCHMSGYDDPIGRDIKTPITFMIGGITKKHTHGGMWRQLIGRSGGQVGIALRAKDTEMGVCGWHVVKQVGGLTILSHQDPRCQ